MEDQTKSTENQCSRETIVVAGETSLSAAKQSNVKSPVAGNCKSSSSTELYYNLSRVRLVPRRVTPESDTRAQPRKCTETQPMEGSLLLGNLPLNSAGLQSTGTVVKDQTGNQSFEGTGVIEGQPLTSPELQYIRENEEYDLSAENLFAMEDPVLDMSVTEEQANVSLGNQSNSETSIIEDHQKTGMAAGSQFYSSPSRLFPGKDPHSQPVSTSIVGDQSRMSAAKTTDNKPIITDDGRNQSVSQTDTRATWWLSIAQYLSNDLQSASLCDLALQGRDGVVMAHGVVMAAISPVICSHMSLATSHMVTFDLPGVSYCTLTQLVHYTYHGSIDLSGTSVQEFLSVATTLGMSPVNYTFDKVSNSPKTKEQGGYNGQNQPESNVPCSEVKPNGQRGQRLHCPNCPQWFSDVLNYDHHVNMDTCHTPQTASHSTVSDYKRSRSASYDAENSLESAPVKQEPGEVSYQSQYDVENDEESSGSDERFTVARNLRRGKKRKGKGLTSKGKKHSSPQSYVCKICLRSFTYRASFDKHVAWALCQIEDRIQRGKGQYSPQPIEVKPTWYESTGSQSSFTLVPNTSTLLGLGEGNLHTTEAEKSKAATVRTLPASLFRGKNGRLKKTVTHLCEHCPMRFDYKMLLSNHMARCHPEICTAPKRAATKPNAHRGVTLTTGENITASGRSRAGTDKTSGGREFQLRPVKPRQYTDGATDRGPSSGDELATEGSASESDSDSNHNSSTLDSGDGESDIDRSKTDGLFAGSGNEKWGKWATLVKAFLDNETGIKCPKCGLEQESLWRFEDHLKNVCLFQKPQNFLKAAKRKVFEAYRNSGDPTKYIAMMKSDKKFVDSLQLQQHTEKVVPWTKQGDKYMCGTCGRQYVDRRSVQHHMYENHNLSSCFGCLKCNRQFRRLKECLAHIADHIVAEKFNTEVKSVILENNRCLSCDQIFPDVIDVEQHKKFCQQDKQTKICPHCGLRFSGVSARSSMARHIKYQHEQHRDTCPICNKKIIRLDRHLKTVHGGASEVDYTFVCSQCGKNFNRRDNLKVHERIHSGDKPFSCDICGQEFRLRCLLKSHQEKHVSPAK